MGVGRRRVKKQEVGLGVREDWWCRGTSVLVAPAWGKREDKGLGGGADGAVAAIIRIRGVEDGQGADTGLCVPKGGTNGLTQGGGVSGQALPNYDVSNLVWESLWARLKDPCLNL